MVPGWVGAVMELVMDQLRSGAHTETWRCCEEGGSQIECRRKKKTNMVQAMSI